MAPLIFRLEEASYLAGMEAAYQGWVNGARAVNSKVETRKIYLNSFDDAAALGVFQAAKEQPRVYVFGANADQSQLAPDRVLGSAIIDLPRAFLLVAEQVKAGTWRPKVEAFGLASGVVRYHSNPALDSQVPAALKSRVQAAADSIAAGTLIAAPRPASMQASLFSCVLRALCASVVNRLHQPGPA